MQEMKTTYFSVRMDTLLKRDSKEHTTHLTFKLDNTRVEAISKVIRQGTSAFLTTTAQVALKKYMLHVHVHTLAPNKFVAYYLKTLSTKNTLEQSKNS